MPFVRLRAARPNDVVFIVDGKRITAPDGEMLATASPPPANFGFAIALAPGRQVVGFV